MNQCYCDDDHYEDPPTLRRLLHAYQSLLRAAPQYAERQLVNLRKRRLHLLEIARLDRRQVWLELRRLEQSPDWPGQPPYLVFRKIWLARGNRQRLQMSVVGPDQLGAAAEQFRPSRGYEIELYNSYADAYLAAAKPLETITLDYWTGKLADERERRKANERAIRKEKFGRPETKPERNTRHRRQWRESGQTANKYATQHAGEDGLSSGRIRGILGQRPVMRID
jgi:hypothetical protein